MVATHGRFFCGKSMPKAMPAVGPETLSTSMRFVRRGVRGTHLETPSCKESESELEATAEERTNCTVTVDRGSGVAGGTARRCCLLLPSTTCVGHTGYSAVSRRQPYHGIARIPLDLDRAQATAAGSEPQAHAGCIMYHGTRTAVRRALSSFHPCAYLGTGWYTVPVQ